MSAENDLSPVLKRLRLSGVLESLDLRIRQAVDDDIDHAEFLYRILQDELERREAKQLCQRMGRAKFDSSKEIEDFDFRFNPDVPKAKVIDLATCAFVEKNENVCLLGKAGVGKSHLAQAIGQRAVRAGHTVVYVRANNLFSSMKAARADGSLDKVLSKFLKPKLLIIDDFGLRPLRATEPEDFFEVIRGRYEKAATILTSNRDLDEWLPLFGDDLLASATMDRLLHHHHKILLTGESYRNPPIGKRS